MQTPDGIDTVQPTSSLADYLNQIRLTAEKRERTSTADAVTEVIALIRAGNTLSLILEGADRLGDFAGTALRLSLTPPTIDMNRRRYKLYELLRYDGQEFIWNAYRALLKREPDVTGFRGFSERLASGQRTRVDILASIRYSSEGRRKNVHIRGLLSKALLNRAVRLLKTRLQSRSLKS